MRLARETKRFGVLPVVLPTPMHHDGDSIMLVASVIVAGVGWHGRGRWY